MVKGDAYGHGIVEVAKYVEPFVYGFGVANLEEGVRLRENNISKPILVCQCLPQEMAVAKEYNLVATVGNFQALSSAKKMAVSVALKINTGMNRFGFDTNEIHCLKTKIEDIPLTDVYSHLYSQDSAESQRQTFDKAVEYLGVNCQSHIGASLTAKDSDDIVRVGYNCYKGAMTVESRVVAVRKLQKGDNVGYGNTFEYSGYVAWVFGGYADGINRQNPQPVLIGGKICPTVAVCMDTICVYTGDYQCKVGEVAVLQNRLITAEFIAEKTNTIPYTVLTGRNGRINRIYTK